MNIQQMIDKLNALKEEHGNLQIYVNVNDGTGVAMEVADTVEPVFDGVNWTKPFGLCVF